MTPEEKSNKYVMGLDVYSEISKPTEGMACICVLNRENNSVEYVNSFRVSGYNINKIAEKEAKKISEHYGNCYIMKEC